MKPKYRLKKGPDICDFVCEQIDEGVAKLNTRYHYFSLRSDARAFAKIQNERGFRVRTFKISYKLVADTKCKGRK